MLCLVFASEVRGRMRLRGGGLRSSSETIETVAATIVEGKYGAQSMSVSSKQTGKLCYWIFLTSANSRKVASVFMKPRDELNRLCPRRRPQSSVVVRTPPIPQTLWSHPNILITKGALLPSVFITRAHRLCFDPGVPNH